VELQQAIARVVGRGDLSEDEMAAALGRVMDGEATPAQIAGLLIALRMKGETPAEIAGAARAMRARATPIRCPDPERAVDTCGTGGDGRGTLNVSTLAAICVAASGVRVAKHGNRAQSSRAGSADVLEALGIAIDAPLPVLERCLDELGIAFLFAPAFHAATRHAAGPRRELGTRTLFNLLGPLTNPAGATRQLVGVPRPEHTELMARALMLLGTTRAWVVHGADGIDELTTTGYTKISECRDGAVNTFYLHPADVGLAKAPAGALQGGDAHENARIIERILDGTRGPARDVVLLNAGAALFIAGAAASVDDGILKASRAIDRGDAKRTLERLVSISTAEEFTAGASA